MSLSAKVTLIMAFTMALLVAFSNTVLFAIVGPSFAELEAQESLSNFYRVERSIARELQFVRQIAEDWSSWDETYDFAEDRNEHYRKVNLVYPTFEGLGINAILIFDRAGSLVWSGIYDLETAQEIELDIFYPEDLKPSSRLVRRKSEVDKTGGMLMTRRGPLLMASLPILTKDDEGPVRGTLIMGRFLNERSVEELEQQTNVRFYASLFEEQSQELPPSIAAKLGRTSSGPLKFESANEISTYAVFQDINDSRSLLLRVVTPKQISKIGDQTIWVAALLIGLSGSIALLVMSAFLIRYVLNPIGQLTKQVVSVSEGGMFNNEIQKEAKDEIGILNREFRSMIERLKSARQELLDQSYKAGMAETASGTLHNIRNGLSPVVSRVSQIRTRIENSPVEKLMKAIAETSNEATPIDRRQKFKRYAELATEGLLERDREIARNLEGVTNQVAEIEKILNWQDEFARAELIIEDVDLCEAIKSAFSLTPKELAAPIEFVFDPSIKQLKSVKAQRMSLVQIFQNVLINATEACADKDQARILICAQSVTDLKHKKSVRISISDNGMGIRPAELDKLFTRSYTTKTGARRGLGLHWCANALAVMNGKIYAESNGPDCGTTFHITLPAE